MAKNKPTQEELDRFHKWFAVTANNQAWDLAEKIDRTPDEDISLRKVAYAAVYHWERIGTPVQINRSNMLLAFASALLGEGERAIQIGTPTFEFVADPANESPDWEQALAEVVKAAVAKANRDSAEYEALIERATARVAGLDEENRGIIQASLDAAVHAPV